MSQARQKQACKCLANFLNWARLVRYSLPRPDPRNPAAATPPPLVPPLSSPAPLPTPHPPAPPLSHPTDAPRPQPCAPSLLTPSSVGHHHGPQLRTGTDGELSSSGTTDDPHLACLVASTCIHCWSVHELERFPSPRPGASLRRRGRGSGWCWCGSGRARGSRRASSGRALTSPIQQGQVDYWIPHHGSSEGRSTAPWFGDAVQSCLLDGVAVLPRRGRRQLQPPPSVTWWR